MQNTYETKININNETIPCVFTTSKRAKNLRLVIYKFKVKVVIPKSCSFDEAYRFLTSNSEWVYKNYKKYCLIQEQNKKKEWSISDKVLYSGEYFSLEVRFYDKIETKVTLENSQILVYLPDNTAKDFKNSDIKNIFTKWLMDMAYETFSNRIKHFREVLGLGFNTAKIKNLKSKWGSCSGKKNLNFNWRLIMAPQFVLDYVIIHEMCHLRHMNHSDRFWDMVRSYCPDYTLAKDWLRENGNLVMEW